MTPAEEDVRGVRVWECAHCTSMRPVDEWPVDPEESMPTCPDCGSMYLLSPEEYVAHALTPAAIEKRREAVVGEAIRVLSPHSSHPITTCRISEQVVDCVLSLLGLAGDDDTGSER